MKNSIHLLKNEFPFLEKLFSKLILISFFTCLKAFSPLIFLTPFDLHSTVIVLRHFRYCPPSPLPLQAVSDRGAETRSRKQYWFLPLWWKLANWSPPLRQKPIMAFAFVAETNSGLCLFLPLW